MNWARWEAGWLLLWLSCSLSLFISACGGGGSAPPPPPPPPGITTTTLADGTSGQSYNQTLQATGGTGNLTWSIAGGSLPPGLSLAASTGMISGAPPSTGSGTTGIFGFTVQVQDSAAPPRMATQALSIRVERPVRILTTSLPDGSVDLSYASNVVITGGGPGPFNLSVSSGALPLGLTMSTAGLISGTPSTAGTFSFTARVQDSAIPPRTATRGLLIRVAGSLAITTTSLPAGTVLAQYSGTLRATGGTPPRTWSVTSGGEALTAAGLALNSTTGEIFGTLNNTPGPVNFMVQVMDSATPAVTASKAFTITLAPASGAGSLGCNDIIPKATPLSNGTYQASISPLRNVPCDAAAGVPDVDVYKLTANGGVIVSIEITAQRLLVPSSLDSVIEIVDVNNTRLTSCRSAGSATGLFNEACMNDDIDSSTTDSRLEFQVPAGQPMTFYVRVLDFRGDARPDFIYTITISGAN